MHTLYCVPLGETMRDEFISKMMKAAAAGKGREQAYLLPSVDLLHAGRKDVQALGLPGYEAPNLLSFDELAEEIIAAAGWQRRRMSRMTQELLVAEVLAELKGNGRLPYFSTIAAFPGYVSTVTSLLAEIKRTGTSPEQFFEAAAARDWPSKDQEVYAIYTVYQQCLDELGLTDLEETYFLAIEALKDEQTKINYQHLYISEFYILTPLQLELVRQLRSRLVMDISIIYEKNRPEVFAAAETTYGDLVGMGFDPKFVAARRQTAASLASVRRRLFAMDGQPEESAGGLEMISTPNRGKEMAVAAGKIKALLVSGSYRPEEIAVVVRDVALYAGFRQTCAQFGVPVSLPWEEELADQALFRLMDHAMSARLDRGSRASVLNLLKSPLLAGLLADADELERDAANVFIRSWSDWQRVWSKGERRDNGFINLRRLVTSLPAEGSPGRMAEALKSFIAKLDVPTWLGDGYRSGRLPQDRLKAGLLAYEAVVGTDGILDKIEEGFALLGISEKKLKLAVFLKLFRQMVAGETVRLEGYHDDGVQVLSPARVRGLSFRAVFILGLTDGEFPLRARENWLYDDRERIAFGDDKVGVSLITAAFRQREEDLYFAGAAALADEILVVSCHEDAATMPSPYMEEVTRLFASGAVKQERYSVGDLFPADYDAVYSADGLTGRALVDTFAGGCPEEISMAAGQYVLDNLVDGDFARRLAAEAERLAGGASVYSGLVGTAGPYGEEKKSFSITALEDYALCPFSFYAKRLLGLDEWAEKEEEAGFDVVGTIYHEALADFLRGHAGQRLQTDKTEEYYCELLAIVAAIFDRLIAEHIIVDGKLWKYQRQRLEKVLRRWLEFEIKEQNTEGLALRPEFFEWGFGLPVKAGMDAASVTLPLTLEMDGQTIKIVGKVDRVDRAGDILTVTDYKRKSCPPYRRLAQGIDLQAALYVMAVERFLCRSGEKVAGGGYYSVEAGKKEGGMWRAELADAMGHRAAKRDGNLAEDEWSAVQEKLQRQVSSYVAGIRAGRFAVAPTADCPPYCVGRDICRYQKDQMAKQKAGGNVNG
ncbi:MAG: PD-(D/E)XK nuclease family protein [Negativicutes bacterium]|nr:PD-(D/E)XK nuclease family protein [Negativicutes bacterium]